MAIHRINYAEVEVIVVYSPEKKLSTSVSQSEGLVIRSTNFGFCQKFGRGWDGFTDL
jgi:hypothetical protein